MVYIYPVSNGFDHFFARDLYDEKSHFACTVWWNCKTFWEYRDGFSPRRFWGYRDGLWVCRGDVLWDVKLNGYLWADDLQPYEGEKLPESWLAAIKRGKCKGGGKDSKGGKEGKGDKGGTGDKGGGKRKGDITQGAPSCLGSGSGED